MTGREDRTTRPWLRPLLVGAATVVVVVVVVSIRLLGRWTQVTPVPPAAVERVFAAARLEAGGGPPYVAIEPDGRVIVHHDQEPAHPRRFATLTLLAWDPGEDKAVRIVYPRWFVRMKTSTFVNLGTMIALARRDWKHVDLDIRFADLERRGPALVLDATSAKGARILLWTSAGGG